MMMEREGTSLCVVAIATTYVATTYIAPTLHRYDKYLVQSKMRVWYCFCDTQCLEKNITYMSLIITSSVVTNITITQYRRACDNQYFVATAASRRYFVELTLNQCTDIITTILPSGLTRLAIYESTIHKLLFFTPCDKDDREMMLKNLILMVRHRCNCPAAVLASVRSDYNRFDKGSAPFSTMLKFMIDKIGYEV